MKDTRDDAEDIHLLRSVDAEQRECLPSAGKVFKVIDSWDNWRLALIGEVENIRMVCTVTGPKFKVTIIDLNYNPRSKVKHKYFQPYWVMITRRLVSYKYVFDVLLIQT